MSVLQKNQRSHVIISEEIREFCDTVLLKSKDPQADWPSRSTVCDILLRAGLIRQRTRRRKPGHPGKPISIATAPNDLLRADFKGQFKTRDCHYCYPLTVTDRYSRYLNRGSSRHAQTDKCVTHVSRLICYPCPRSFIRDA